MGLRDAGYEHRRKKFLIRITRIILFGGIIGALIGVFLGNTIFNEYGVEAIKNTAALTLIGAAVAQMHSPKIYLIPSIIVGAIGAALGIEFGGVVLDIASNSFTAFMTIIAVIMTLVGTLIGNVIIEFLFDLKIIR